MFAGMSIASSYDWNENNRSLCFTLSAIHTCSTVEVMLDFSAVTVALTISSECLLLLLVLRTPRSTCNHSLNQRVLLFYPPFTRCSTLPLHSEALLDRLRSWGGPEKRLWALIDNFGNHLGRQARLRANALALTRCPESIGTTYLPQ